MVQKPRPPGTLQRWSELPPPADSCTASRRPRVAVSPPPAPRRACLCRTCLARFPSPLRQTAARSRTAERATRQLAFLPPGLPAAPSIPATEPVPPCAWLFPAERVPASKTAWKQCAPVAQATPESSFPPALGTPAPARPAQKATPACRTGASTQNCGRARKGSPPTLGNLQRVRE